MLPVAGPPAAGRRQRTLAVVVLAAGALAAPWALTLWRARDHLHRGEALHPARPLEAVRELQTALLLRSPGNRYATKAASRLEEILAAAEAEGDARLARHVRDVLETAPRATASAWNGGGRGWPGAASGAFLVAWVMLVARVAMGDGRRSHVAAAILCYVAWLVALWAA